MLKRIPVYFAMQIFLDKHKQKRINISNTELQELLQIQDKSNNHNMHMGLCCHVISSQ